ncbi:MAG: phosphoglucosamine mutase, partial [Deferribacteraceae bacterium]|nr:phosphoglucosamine mutase [Deferribacteraceae bacterium]
GKSISELASQIKILPQSLVSVNVSRKVPIDELPKTKAIIKEVEETLKDSGRLLVRYSGTENKLRVMSEGEDQTQIDRFVNEIAACAVGEIG